VRGHSSAAAIGVWIVAGAGLAAAGVWEKPFTTWTPKEIKELRTDSPWAGKMTLTHVKPGGDPRPIDDTIVARWSSAVPIRQADLRDALGADGVVTPEMQAALAVPYDGYEVTLTIEGVSAGVAAMQPVPIGRETFLKRDGKPPIAAVKVESRRLDKNGKVIEVPVRQEGGRGQPPAAPAAAEAAAPAGDGQTATPAQPAAGRGGGRGGFGGGGFGGGGGGGSTLMIFVFPKTDPITVADKEVEISTKIGQYNAKKKFKLKDMVINGEPAL
jgi:hypothetical protein